MWGGGLGGGGQVQGFEMLRQVVNVIECFWNVMAHVHNPDFVFRRDGQVHLSRRGRQFSRLLAAEVCASAVVMVDTPCSVVVWRVLATHSIRHFSHHFPSRAPPYAITFQLDSNHCALECEIVSSLKLRWRILLIFRLISWTGAIKDTLVSVNLVIKSREVRWSGHARMGAIDVHRERERDDCKPRRSWDDNIKMDLQELWWSAGYLKIWTSGRLFWE